MKMNVMIVVIMFMFGLVVTVAEEEISAEGASGEEADAGEETPSGGEKPAEVSGNDGGAGEKGEPCKGHGTRKADESTDCKEFTICNVGRLVRDKCPDGMVFSDNENTCRFPTTKEGGCPKGKSGGGEEKDAKK